MRLVITGTGKKGNGKKGNAHGPGKKGNGKREIFYC